MEAQRKAWNTKQKTFRQILLSGEQYPQAMQMFQEQHAALHTIEISPEAGWSFQDEVLSGMRHDLYRRIPERGEHSIAWLLWHMARIEDVAMNLLVAGQAQVFTGEGWQERMGVHLTNTGNAMPAEAVISLSREIDIQALLAYRLSVGRQTRQIASGLSAQDLKRKVDPTRLQCALDEGAVLPEAGGVIDYWSKRNIAGLLLIPATRHNFVHLNEALKVRKNLKQDEIW